MLRARYQNPGVKQMILVTWPAFDVDASAGDSRNSGAFLETRVNRLEIILNLRFSPVNRV